MAPTTMAPTTTATSNRAPSPADLRVATCAAPTNIAVVKYWGKGDEALNTPLNSSVSVTLHDEQLRATTTVASAPWFTTTKLWLNGTEHPVGKRAATVIREMRRLARDPTQWEHASLHIVSENSFPTAAGLASSAAGYACLVAALAALFEAHEQFPGQFSTVARQGSGSACRSLDGGFVRWEMGTGDADSRAVQVCDEHHWPELRAIICVVSDREKDTSSTSGMQNTKRTSALLAYRAEHVVAERLDAIETAYKAKDFPAFGVLTMRDSNQFHATCLDTFPPIFYLNEVSRRIIHLVHAYNHHAGRVQAAYTFDAGPNAVIFLEAQHVQEMMTLLLESFPSSSSSVPVPIKSSTAVRRDLAVEPALRTAAKLPLRDMPVDSIKLLYVSRVGGGARVLGQDEALVNLATGEPILRKPTASRAASASANRPVEKRVWLPYVAVAAACASLVVAAFTAKR